MDIFRWFRREPAPPPTIQELIAQMQQLQRRMDQLQTQQRHLAENLADCFSESELIARSIEARVRHVPKWQHWWYG